MSLTDWSILIDWRVLTDRSFRSTKCLDRLEILDRLEPLDRQELFDRLEFLDKSIYEMLTIETAACMLQTVGLVIFTYGATFIFNKIML